MLNVTVDRFGQCGGRDHVPQGRPGGARQCREHAQVSEVSRRGGVVSGAGDDVGSVRVEKSQDSLLQRDDSRTGVEVVTAGGAVQSVPQQRGFRSRPSGPPTPGIGRGATRRCACSAGARRRRVGCCGPVGGNAGRDAPAAAGDRCRRRPQAGARFCARLRRGRAGSGCRFWQGIAGSSACGVRRSTGPAARVSDTDCPRLQTEFVDLVGGQPDRLSEGCPDGPAA